MAEDKVHIGLNLEANNVADLLEESDFFEDRLAIAKFALAYAIKNKFDEDLENLKVSDSGGTKWNVGSVDNDQYLKSVVNSLYPDVETPYRQVELLMNNGLIKIGEVIDREGLHNISNLM